MSARSATLTERSDSQDSLHRSRSPVKKESAPPTLHPRSLRAIRSHETKEATPMMRSCSMQERIRTTRKGSYKRPRSNTAIGLSRGSELINKESPQDDAGEKPKKISCASLPSPTAETNAVITYPRATGLASLLGHGFLPESPVLTDVLTRDAMAIVKLETKAVLLHRKLIQEARKRPTEEVLSHLRCAVTEKFSLSVKPGADDVTKYDVIFKLYPDGCSDEEATKSVSVFVSISCNEGTSSDTPLVVTFFLRNKKNEIGYSFKKSIKLIPSEFPVERGIRNFVSIGEFDEILERDTVISFGVLIRQNSM